MNRIYYFSGTGNTLAVARKIAELLGDTELIAIADLQRGEDVDFGDAERVGIFHPVYCFGIPNLVAQFIGRIKKMLLWILLSALTGAVTGFVGAATWNTLANTYRDVIEN